jgi:hypothetical protein
MAQMVPDIRAFSTKYIIGISPIGDASETICWRNHDRQSGLNSKVRELERSVERLGKNRLA